MSLYGTLTRNTGNPTIGGVDTTDAKHERNKIQRWKPNIKDGKTAKIIECK